MRKTFWGDPVIGNPPNQSKRADMLAELLVDSFNPIEKEFHFRIGSNHRVCERGVLLGLGNIITKIEC